MIKDALIEVLESEAGIGLDLFQHLVAYRLEDGRYSVIDHRVGIDGKESVFDSASDAVDHFLKCREQYGLGFDHER